jgi:hypothetical protein
MINFTLLTNGLILVEVLTKVAVSVTVWKKLVKTPLILLPVNGLVLNVQLNVLTVTCKMMIGVLFALLATWDISVLGVLKNVSVVVLTKNVLPVIKNNKSVISIFMTLKMRLITISLLIISNPNMMTNSITLCSRLMVVYLLIQLVSVPEMILVIPTVPVMKPVKLTWTVWTKDSNLTVTVTTSL